MPALLDLPADLASVSAPLARHLANVEARFNRQLESDIPPVRDLCRHIERYRGKMLRPTLVLLCGLASGEQHITPNHETVGAVCEMVHMATLVHDDVLDEADTRRLGHTINRLHGNEAAVILGDHLIASAYHLCSQVDLPTSLAVAKASKEMCAGELLQLHHRGDFSLDEPTYFEIVDRKTAELIAVACELGARHSGACDAEVAAAARFGRAAGVAFQIQDDLLDLVGDERVVGKSLGKDLDKGKLTLPVIHHLTVCDPRTRGETLRLLHAASEGDTSPETRARLVSHLRESRSLEYAKDISRRLVGDARAAAATLPASPARRVLELLADAVVARER